MPDFADLHHVQCRDRRRLDPSMRIVPGTDCAALRYETKSPRPAPGAHAQTAGFSLPVDLEAGSATWAAVRAAAQDVTGGDKLDPERTVAFVVRGGTGLAKCIQAALLRTRRCRGESRQLEDHPRAAIQFLHAEGQGRPFGGHLDLGTRSYVGFSGDGEILAIAAENDWRPRRCSGAQDPVSGANETTEATPASARTASYRSAASTAGTGACATTATTTTAGGGANSHTPDVALAHGCVPGGLDLAGFVDGDSVVCVVDENVGIGDTADRAVLVVEYRSLVAPITVIIVAPLKLHRREIHRLGVDEFRALYSVVGAHSEAGIQQVRDRSRLAGGVVLEIHEGDILQFMTVIVELVAADREIRECGLRQAAAVRHFRRRPRIADILGLADEQRVNHP